MRLSCHRPMPSAPLRNAQAPIQAPTVGARLMCVRDVCAQVARPFHQFFSDKRLDEIGRYVEPEGADSAGTAAGYGDAAEEEDAAGEDEEEEHGEELSNAVVLDEQGGEQVRREGTGQGCSEDEPSLAVTLCVQACKSRPAPWTSGLGSRPRPRKLVATDWFASPALTSLLEVLADGVSRCCSGY